MDDRKHRFHCNDCGEPIHPRRYSAHWSHFDDRLQKTCCKSPCPTELLNSDDL